MYSANFFNYLGLYSNMANEASPGTPRKLANEMLDRLPAALWSDPNKTFLDPSMTNGMFYFLMVERLFDGLAEKIPDPCKRITHILTKQVWGYEMNEAPFEFVKKMLNKQFGIGSSINIEPNLCYNNILDEELNMKFDVVVMNPPYQDAPKSKKNNGSATGNTLWNKFVVNCINSWTSKDGYVCAVHPSGWRKPESERSKYKGMLNLMCHKHHMQYLEIHDAKDGKKTFNAGTRYDWYVIAKNKSGSTIIKDQNGHTAQIDLKKHSWLPNHSFEIVFNNLGNGASVIYNRSNYGSDKAHTSSSKSGDFVYPLLHSTTKKGNRFYYSSLNNKGHFGVSKVIFGTSGINDVIIDIKGEYGMTEESMALPIRDYKDGLIAKEYLMSEKFKNILSACSWSNFRIDWRMFTYFKEGFWRD
tara:strand:- start:318 stop:1562 length:1245 start_codon:yes stop_codon:yes gene_type:complete